jgi:hypothetical protein
VRAVGIEIIEHDEIIGAHKQNMARNVPNSGDFFVTLSGVGGEIIKMGDVGDFFQVTITAGKIFGITPTAPGTVLALTIDQQRIVIFGFAITNPY